MSHDFENRYSLLIDCASKKTPNQIRQKGTTIVKSQSKTSIDRSAAGLETDSRWQLVQRIIASQPFVKSSRLQGFLMYVCRCWLENRQDEISEQKIGERVFQRPADYNPNEDNIVRSQARLLRQKLDVYFASEGEHEPIILNIPKGGYAPEFVDRAEENPGEAVELDGSIYQPWRTPIVRSLIVAVLALIVVIIVLTWRLAQAEKPLQPAVPLPASSSVSDLWSQLFSENLTTTVIVSDHTFSMLQELSKEYVDLSTYLRRSTQIDDENLQQMEKKLRGFSIRRYTTFDSVSTAVRVAELAGQFRGKLVVRYARDLTLRELSPGNAVIIGRPLTNLWNEVFEKKLNFRFYSDLQSGTVICQNRSPQAGEQAEYSPVEEGAKRTVYASVAFLPNLNNSGNVLIIAGTSSGAQEIAAEFVTNETLFNDLTNRIRKGDERLPYFEVLLRTITLAGVAQEPEVIAYRILQP